MVSITVGASFAKNLFPLIGAAGTTTLRLVVAALVLSVLLRVWRVPLNRRSLLAALPYGLAMGAMNLLFYMAIERIPLGIAIAVEFTGPLAVTICLSRRLTDLAWIALAVGGLLLLLPLGGTSHAIDLGGIGLALAAGVFWAAYILFGQRAGAALGTQAAALGMIIGMMLAMPFGIAEAGHDLLRPEILIVAVVVGILSSAIPYSLEMYALRRMPAKSFGILMSAEPAVGAVMGMLLLGEMLPVGKWLGIAAIIAASAGTTMTNRSKKLDALDSIAAT
jgi:inner membrane transporter RhtA